MRAPVRISTDHDGIARIAIDRPPLNTLGADVRKALMQAFAAATQDPHVRLILLTAEGRTFPVGGDLSELDSPQEAPDLAELCALVESCGKPVLAAVHGSVLGGGLELALAAHYRIAADTAHLGLPEISLGLPPGAGGTQRLPRLAAARAALAMMLDGGSVSAGQAAEMGILDKVAPEADLAVAARRYAQDLLDEGAGPRETRLRTDGVKDVPAFQAAVAEARKRVAHNPVPAAARIVDCVEGALLLPFDVGCAFEHEAYEACLKSAPSRALRHVFLAERRAVQRTPEAGPLPDRIAVVGHGPRAAGLVVALLRCGQAVTWVSHDPRAATELVAREIRDEAAFARLAATAQVSDLSGAELVLAVLPRDATLARASLDELVDHADDDAVLGLCGATPDQLSRVPGPHRVAGLWLPEGTQQARIAEIWALSGTNAATLSMLSGVFRRMGRLSIRTNGGGVAAAVQAAALQAADGMLQRGAAPYEVDAAMRGAGVALGPYQRLDRIGRVADGGVFGALLAQRGMTGRDAGVGFYRHDSAGGTMSEDREVLRLLQGWQAEQGVSRRRFEAQEIRQRLFAAMANAGARLLAEGRVDDPGDIDLAMVLGQGFPRWRGGPMLLADEQGLLMVKNTLEVLTAEDPAFWSPSPLFAELIKNGWHFNAPGG